MSVEHDVIDKWPDEHKGDVLCVVHPTTCLKLGVHDSCLYITKVTKKFSE